MITRRTSMGTRDLSFLRHAPTLLPLAIPGMLILLLWPALAHAVEVWSTIEEFRYGFLVLPVALLLVWHRRVVLRHSLGPGASIGLLVVVPSLGVYLLAHRLGINALAGLAVSPLLWGIAIYLWGWALARALAFPIGFLAFGLALYRPLLGGVGFRLQEVTALGAAALAHAVGLPVMQDGFILYGGGFAFAVAEACSGLSSLLALLALAALWTYLVPTAWPGRLVLLVSVVPLVVLANIVRVTLVLWVASGAGQDVAVGFFHGASSLVLYGLAVGGLVAVGRGVECKTPASAI